MESMLSALVNAQGEELDKPQVHLVGSLMRSNLRSWNQKEEVWLGLSETGMSPWLRGQKVGRFCVKVWRPKDQHLLVCQYANQDKPLCPGWRVDLMAENFFLSPRRKTHSWRELLFYELRQKCGEQTKDSPT